jgi:hypothetical protein
LQEVLKKEPQSAGARAFLCISYWRRGDTLSRLGQHAAALRDWNLALNYDDGNKQVPIRISRALGSARAGNHQQALEDVSVLAQRKSLGGGDLYRMACVYSRCASGTQAEQHAARAVELLRKADAAGCFKDPANIERLKKEAAFVPLHSREDFKTLLNELQEKAN